MSDIRHALAWLVRFLSAFRHEVETAWGKAGYDAETLEIYGGDFVIGDRRAPRGKE